MPLSLRPADSAADGSRSRCSGLAKHFGGLKAVDGVDFTVRRGTRACADRPERLAARRRRSTSSPASIARPRERSWSTASTSPPCRRTSAPRRPRAHVPEHPPVPLDDRAGECRDRRRARTATRLGQSAPTRCARARWPRSISSASRRRAPARSIPSFTYGHQRLIEIARALAAIPTVLLLDEPAAGLNSSEKKALHDLLDRIAAHGLTILIIDHDMTLIARVADHLTVLNFGRRIADGETASVLREPDVVAAYLGAS